MKARRLLSPLFFAWIFIFTFRLCLDSPSKILSKTKAFRFSILIFDYVWTRPKTRNKRPNRVFHAVQFIRMTHPPQHVTLGDSARQRGWIDTTRTREAPSTAGGSRGPTRSLWSALEVVHRPSPFDGRRLMLSGAHVETFTATATQHFTATPKASEESKVCSRKCCGRYFFLHSTRGISGVWYSRHCEFDRLCTGSVDKFSGLSFGPKHSQILPPVVGVEADYFQWGQLEYLKYY